MADVKASIEISAIDNATRTVNQVGAAAKNLEKTYDSLKSTFEAGIGAFALERIINETVEWEKASNRLNATLRATGGAVGLTRKELDELAESMSRTTEFSQKQVTNAEAELISFGGMHEEIFRDALKDTVDLAAKMGTDLVSAAHLVGRAYQDPTLGLRGFQKELGTLTFVQKEYLAQLMANGRVEEAQLALHDLIQNKIGGTAELMNTGLTKAVADNQKAWEELETTLGNASKGAIVGVAGEISRWWGGVTNMIRQARGEALQGLPQAQINQLLGTAGASGSWGDSAEEEATRAAAAADRLVLADNRIREAHAKAVPVLAQWNRMLGDQTNEERALDMVLKGEARSWNDLDKVKLLNLAVEQDWRNVYKQREDLSARYAAALRDETQGEEENLATRVKVYEDAFSVGTRTSFQEYVKHARDGAEQASFFFRNAFQNMEDAMVQFAMTGKINLHDLANSWIADLIRIQIRQQLAGFASAGPGFLGSLGGSLGLSSTTSALEVHSGGVIGAGGGRPRDVDSRVFIGAPRMHMGGLAGDEVPAILQRGERVIPRGGSSGPVFQQHFHIAGNVTRADLAAVAEAGRLGAMAGIAEERRRNPTGPFGG